MTESSLHAYSRLILSRGVNVQKGQILFTDQEIALIRNERGTDG